MKSFQNISDVKFENSWVTIGSFDGVHIGHQTIIRDLVQSAHLSGNPAIAVTFYPHPVVVLKNIQNPYYLTTPQERMELMAALGLDAVITLKFDPALAEMSADQFIELLDKQLGLRELWVGEGFALGKGRQGNVKYLSELGTRLGFNVRQNKIVQMNGAPVSSSLIRTLIMNTNVDKAADLLGRPYRMTGKVVHGEGRGRQMGIPTANLEVNPEKLLPGNGIYATWLWWDRKRYPSVTNVGFRPTFEKTSSTPLIEPYIMDFDQELYGEQLTIEFLKYIRPEQKFDSVEMLVNKIRQDIHQAEEVFINAPRTPGIST